MFTITVVFCFMLELMDVSIVNVAITHMMGNLGATLNEVSWFIVTYAIVNMIIILMAVFLSERFGRRNYFTTSVIVFTVASVCCGLSTGIWELASVSFSPRDGRGSVAYHFTDYINRNFPEKDLELANSLFGMGIIIGPMLGRVLVENLY